MPITVLTDAAYATHATGDHPECPDRWVRSDALLHALAAAGGEPLAFVAPAPVSDADLALVHPPAHAARIKAFCEAGGGRLDEDTVACPESYDVARLSAGGAIEGARRVIDGPDRRAVVLGRPPGHHALAEETMGFCFFNNAALAARWAQARRGLGRVLIVDWDLHHGNGTEAIFAADPTVMYLSTHQHPNWPGTGAATDVGTGEGRGYTANVPLPMGTGDAGYLAAFRAVFRPLVDAFRPELVIVSAGYDAHWRDPLGRMGLTVGGFAALTREVEAWAEAHAQGRLLLLMEGGYDLDALARSLAASVQVLRGGEVADPLGPSPYPEPMADVERAIAASRAALAPYWPALAG